MVINKDFLFRKKRKISANISYLKINRPKISLGEGYLKRYQ
jgi:hypothetical protein